MVDDIVRQSPRTCGRGSGAASIVAYSLGITNVDPIRYNLMFERFLNPGRTDPPDIDVDFAWDERDEVLDYVFRTYGEKHTAMVATHQTCGARMAIREVARIYGLTEHEISLVTKKIPRFAELSEYTSNLEELLRLWPGLKGTALDPPWPDILKDAGCIIGLPRGIGTHPGGVLITPGPIRNEAPVQYSAKGYPIVHWEKDGVEDMGLVKIDLLGNRSLAVIRDAIASLRREGIPFDENSWDPQSDPATMRLLAEGKTIGVFYVESPAMRLLQRKSGKGDFEHLVIHSSIIRPAANRFIREYLKRLRGESWTPLHPLLGELLSETFGIMVYQEDVARVAMALAGFSVEDGDNLRKIMAKKSPGATLDDYRERFFSGAAKRGVVHETVLKIWEMMESFRGYSFCKPHSASYVQVSFQSAWLKVHYPAHFMAAVLGNYGGFYTTQAYISEAMRLGCGIVPPDVNRSGVGYHAGRMTIQVGLCQIKGLSREAMERIISERCGNGDFTTVEDLLDRTGISEQDAEQLLLAGAGDSLDPDASRPRLFWRMRRYFQSGTGGPVPSLGNLSYRQLLQRQYRSLGFLTECHPITLLSSTRKRPGARAGDVDTMAGGKISLFGWCVTSRTVSTTVGDAMEFVTFEDETGVFETVFFPDVYRKYSIYLSWQAAFLVRGKVTREFGVGVVEVEMIERVH
jgi:DNA polymerase-3 subunit alpha/error-prone DNA polymerase